MIAAGSEYADGGGQTEGRCQWHKRLSSTAGHAVERGRDLSPSVTDMDLIEQLMGLDERADYVQVLIGKIRHDRYPSVP